MLDGMFAKRYRLTKDLVLQLCNERQTFMPLPTKSTNLSIETKILIALSFFATGSYQSPTGDITAHSVAQQTVSVVVTQVTKCLNDPYFRRKYTKFPNNANEQRETVTKFYNKFGMPGVLGCIDGTHVAIKRPVQHEERFYCRKHYHSLNVQLVCNSEMEVISVIASNGGATHDSFICANHPLKTYMEGLNNMWFLDAPPDSPEAFYTGVHVRTRNKVERAIAHLKARFRCLLAHRVLYYEPHTATSM